MKLKSFSLQELLVVLVIIGILVMLALPSLLPKITEAKAQEAKLQLKHLYTLQQTYFYTHSKYAQNIVDLGFEQNKLVTEGGSANYIIEIREATNNQFFAEATAVTDFDGDGQFNVWQINQEMELIEMVKD